MRRRFAKSIPGQAEVIAAITKIKAIKSGLVKLLDYAMNPSKTEKKINDFEYAGVYSGEKTLYVSGINCTPEYVKSQMQETKNRFHKAGGNIAYHVIQSFGDDEGTDELVHEIGCKFAEELWGDKYEVIVATHTNTNNRHNHIIINSTSFIDGKKYNDCKDTLRQMREVSDRLCKEYGLSVIENPKQSRDLSYAEYTAERDGKFTKNTVLKHDINECILEATNGKYFESRMKKRGYSFDFSKPHVTVMHPTFKHPRWLSDLGEEYTPEAISKKLSEKWVSYDLKFPMQDDLFNSYFSQPFERTYRNVYVRFVAMIQTASERKNENRQLLYLIQDDIIKLDRLIEQQNLLCGNDIDTPEQLTAYKEKCKAEMTELTEARQKLRNMKRRADRAGNESESAELKEDIFALSERLKKLQKDINICERIEESEPKIEEKIEQIREENEHKKGVKNKNTHLR